MNRFVYTCMVLAFTVTFASCDNPKTKKDSSKSVYSFAFSKKEDEVSRAKQTYTQAVVEKNKPKDDTRTITYSSNSAEIATVNDKDKDKVTFVEHKGGTVIITATKAGTPTKYKKSEASYTLTITVKPADRDELISEIKRITAIEVEGMDADLSYIDTSAITDMSYLFSSRTTFSSEVVSDGTLTKFNGDISKWDVSSVTTMDSMFTGATKFNGDISRWNVSSVTSMDRMFAGATAFTQNLNLWGSKINDAIKARNWVNIFSAFYNSGLADSLPTWCESVPDCKRKSLETPI